LADVISRDGSSAETAYQIQIASDKEHLEQGQTDVWESGKISFDAMSVEIPAQSLFPYAGQSVVA
jgi:hypothetical protein